MNEPDEWAASLRRRLAERCRNEEGSRSSAPEVDLVNVRIPRPSRVPRIDLGFEPEADPFATR